MVTGSANRLPSNKDAITPKWGVRPTSFEPGASGETLKVSWFRKLGLMSALIAVAALVVGVAPAATKILCSHCESDQK